MEQTVQVRSEFWIGTTGAAQLTAECFCSYMQHVQRVGAWPLADSSFCARCCMQPARMPSAA